MDTIIIFQSILKAIQAFGLLKSLAFIVVTIVLLFTVLMFGLNPFFEQVRYERAVLVAADSKQIENLKQSAEPITTLPNPEKKKISMAPDIKTGDIHVTSNTGPTQVNVGSPGSKQVINQQRTISSQTRIEKSQRDGNYIMHIIMNQTDGIWDQGTPLQVNAKISSSYQKASIIQGLPPAMFNVQIGENKEAGEYFFSTTTAPFPGRPIVLEIIAKQDFELKQLGVSPLTSE